MRSSAASRSTRNIALVVGLAGAAACAIFAAFGFASFVQSWLFAWFFFLGIALGSIVNVMIHELTGGDWGFAIRRPLEAAAGTLPLLALGALPLVFGLADLYPWAGRDASAHAALLMQKRWYLNVPFFGLRAIVVFAIWIALALLLRSHWKRRESNAGNASDPDVQKRLRALSIGGLIVYSVTVTIASVDWIVALSADWYSTAFGLIVMVGQSFSAFAFAVALAVFEEAPWSTTRDAARASARISQDLGNILLTYAMLWAYLAFTQFLIIWAEDLPMEIGWYVARSTPFWKSIAVIGLALQFAIPFVAMLFRAFKRNPRSLAWLCAVVLFGHAIEVLWLTAPSLRTNAAPLHALDAIAFVTLGAFWFSAFLTLRAGTPARAEPRPPTAEAGIAS